MSATLMGAVMSCGPKKGSLRYALVAIADHSDDFGFACPSIETIAAKVCQEPRNAMRLVQLLESGGGIKVHRRGLFGKGSGDFLDIARLGGTPDPKARRSPLHVEVMKRLEAAKPAAKPADSADSSSDKLSPEKNEDDFAAPEKSRDNSQGVQVTKTAESGDKKAVPILINRCEPLLNQNNPLPPSKSKGECGEENKTIPVLDHESACAAVQLVLRECDVSDRRMAPVVEQAIRAYRTKSGKSFEEIAEQMVKARQAFLADSHLMRYPVALKKFFAHGFWIDDRMWPFDQEKLNRMRRL